MAENRELALVLRLVADQFSSELKKQQGLLGEFNSFITNWKTQLVAAGGALFAIAKSTANYGEELLKTSQKVGINVQALAGLQHAAHLADVSHEQLAKGLKFLSVNMVEASRHTNDGEALFRRLGVSATDTTGKLRPMEEVLLDVAEKFAQAKDGAGKMEIATKLFGKAGYELIPFLNQGKTGIQELMAEAERLGLVMSESDAKASNKFNDELKKMQGSLRGLTLQIGKELLPVFTQLFDVLKQLGSGPAMSLIKAEFQGLAAIFTLLNHGIRETAAEFQTFFAKIGKSDFVKKFYDEALAQGRKALDADTEKKLRTIFALPGGEPVKGGAGGKSGAGGDKAELGATVDQEKLGKAKVEIFLEMNRAIDIHNSLMAEQASVDRAAYVHLLDFQDQEKKNDEDWQERHGRMAVEQTQLEVKIREEALASVRSGLIDNEQAWVNYYDQIGGHTTDYFAHKEALLKAQLANELVLTQQQSAELLSAWKARDSVRASGILAQSPVSDMQKQTIELKTMTQATEDARGANGSFFEGWQRGMQNYVQQTGNGFNLATKMAQDTAQAMQQGFQTFFFDLMDNKIKSFKDVMRGMLNFVKQIIAQIAAQLVVSKILGLVASGFGGAPAGVVSNPGLSNNFGNFGVGAATGGQVVRRYAMGGPVPGSGMQDTIPALLTPGEYVLSRADMADVKRGLGGGSPINIAITVNAQGGRQQSGTGAAPNFTQLARDLSKLVESKLIEEQRPGGLLAGGAF